MHIVWGGATTQMQKAPDTELSTRRAIGRGPPVTEERGCSCSDDCDMQDRGKRKYDVVARHRNGLALAPGVSRGWTGGSAGPPCLPGVEEAGRRQGPAGGAAGSSKPFPKRPLMEPVARRPLQLALRVAINRESPPLPVKRCGLIILARRHCIPGTGSTWLAGRKPGSQFLLFPCKKVTSTPQAFVQICFSTVQNIL